MLRRDLAVDGFMESIEDRFAVLRAKEPIVHACYMTGQNLGLTEEETLRMTVVALGEAYGLLIQRMVERAERDPGYCVVPKPE